MSQAFIKLQRKGEMVLPDITRLHQVLSVDVRGWANTGDVPAFLTRSSGQLERLLRGARRA